MHQQQACILHATLFQQLCGLLAHYSTPQVHVVDVFGAVATTKRKAERDTQIKWEEVKELLINQFRVEAFEQLCVRLPHGIGHSIQKCIESWKDFDQRVLQQLQHESRRLAPLLQQVTSSVILFTCNPIFAEASCMGRAYIQRCVGRSHLPTGSTCWQS